MKILILNSGSSTIKFKLFEKNKKGLTELKKGLLENIKNHEDGLKMMNDTLMKSGHIKNKIELKCVGHRVVHGGEAYRSFQKIDTKVIQTIKKLASLAPLHNPSNLKGILACQKMFPHATQWAFFDTAFHQTLPEKAWIYALPEIWHAKYGIRKYGFHGTSHEYIAQKAIQYLLEKKLPHKKLISCHIGNGVSITAIHNGKSIDTSMGFTPLEGVPMGTRSGSIDPAIPLIMQRLLQSTPQKIENILNTKSGLLALSGLDSDMRVIYKKSQEQKNIFNQKNSKKTSPRNEAIEIKKAKKAIEIFCYKITQQIGAYIASLNGLDAIIFTAGIGENAWYIRKNIMSSFSYMDIKINFTKNKKNSIDISHEKSKTKILVIPTDEELAMAQKICYNIKMPLVTTH